METDRPCGGNKATGVFFYKQEIKSLVNAVQEFEKNIDVFNPQHCRENAIRFSEERFKQEITQFVDQKWSAFKNNKQIIY